MKSRSRKIAVIGSGAVGGFYGGLLAKSGCEVSFLIHSDFGNISKQGLSIESIWGDFRVLSFPRRIKVSISQEQLSFSNLTEKKQMETSRIEKTSTTKKHVQAHFVKNTEEFDPEIDTILICLKSTENIHLASLLQPFQNNSQQNKIQIVLIQNGIGQERIIHKILPKATVFGGLAFLCSVKKSSGSIQHIDYGDITLAESRVDETACGIGTKLQELGKLFHKAGIPVTLEEDLCLARWKKLVWNIPFNGLSVILQSHTNELVENPASLELIRILMVEVQKAAHSQGREISTTFLEDRLQKTFSMKPYPTSMKLDYANGRPMELDAIYHSVLTLTQNSNTSLPNIKFLLHSLEYLEKSKLNDKK